MSVNDIRHCKKEAIHIQKMTDEQNLITTFISEIKQFLTLLKGFEL